MQRSRCLAPQPEVSRLTAYMSLTPRLCFLWCHGGAGQRALRVSGDHLGLYHKFPGPPIIRGGLKSPGSPRPPASRKVLLWEVRQCIHWEWSLAQQVPADGLLWA